MNLDHGWAHPVTVHHTRIGSRQRCRYCGHPIELYDQVGWIDMTSPYDGGSYDLCDQIAGGAHEPVDG